MEIKKNSLHLRLYHTYAQENLWDLNAGKVNFCQYSRKVMLGFLVTLACVVGGVLAGLGPMQAIGTGVLWLFTDNPFIPFITMNEGFMGAMGNVGLAALIIETIVALFVLGYLVKEKLNEREFFQYTEEKKEPGFIKTWYLSWKEKYCPIMTIEQNETENEV